jgi:hypothetical protein
MVGARPRGTFHTSNEYRGQFPTLLFVTINDQGMGSYGTNAVSFHADSLAGTTVHKAMINWVSIHARLVRYIEWCHSDMIDHDLTRCTRSWTGDLLVGRVVS